MPTSRMHIVLVPGFAGFDALGQLQYFAGTTGVYNKWRDESENLPETVLHYFDNFPTAAVELRAKRLHVFLAKKILRGEIAKDDKITLVGHSTGGLDIRKMLWDLNNDVDDGQRPKSILLDGIGRGRNTVKHREILRAVERAVFLSVPHYGTHIADFSSKVQSLIKPLADQLAEYVESLGNRNLTKKFDVFQLLEIFQSELLQAAIESLMECDESPSDQNLMAAERQNRAELSLWLHHVSRDFRAILDLRTGTPSDSSSPAHFTPNDRAKELVHFSRFDYRDKVSLATLSYVTYARGLDKKAPIAKLVGILFEVLANAETQEKLEEEFEKLLTPFFSLVRVAWQLSDILPVADPKELKESLLFQGFLQLKSRLEKDWGSGKSPSKDLAYLFAEAVCTHHEFLYKENPIHNSAATDQKRIDLNILEGDSDCIVNSPSMIYPIDTAAQGLHLFKAQQADHGDIIGHCELQPFPLPPSGRRKNWAYDVFASASLFQGSDFERVWREIFEFSLGKIPPEVK